MELAINNQVYQQAQMYAHSHGLNLNALIENFLVNLLGEVRAEKKNDVPDVCAQPARGR